MTAQRFLVIRLTALGDVVLAEPVARTLRLAFPGAEVDLLTEARHAAAFRDRAGFDRVIGYDRRGEHAGWRGMSRLIRSLPVPRYDVIVDLQGKLRTRVFAARVPAGRRVTMSKRTLAGAVRSLFGNDPPIDDRHTVDLYLAALAPLGAGPGDRRPRLTAPSTGREVQARLQIGLGIGTTHPTKRWPPERFGALGHRLAAELPNPCFFPIGGPGDRVLIDQVRAALPAGRVTALDVASLDVSGLTELISKLDLLITVDSGPAHLAAALDVPTVVLFGPTSPRRWGPIGDAHRVVTLGLECSPCSNVGSERCPIPARDHQCMKQLPVDDVARAALEVLESARKAGR